MLRAARRPVFGISEIIESSLLTLICTIYFIDLEEQKKRARVHFIPDLKVGVFVTLRAPDVIKNIAVSLSAFLDGWFHQHEGHDYA
jgi:hypothetical protein